MKYEECENLLTKESLLSCFERKIDRNSTDEIDINARFQYINLLIANNRFNDAKKECSAIISIPGVSKQNSDYAKLMMSSIDKTLSEIKNQK